jgi:putative MATE family efflux protein
MADAAAQRRPSRGDLTQGPIAKTLLAFALPTLASSILQSLNGTINAIWVGRFLGEGALAATSNANMVMFLLIAFVFGFGMAATILVGQAWGRKDVAAARRVFGTATGAFALIAVAIGIAGYFLSPMILKLLGTPGDAAPLALAYLRVIFLAMPALLILTLTMMALRGAGDSMTPLWFMLVAVLLDSGLNPVFIRGLGPAPRLGIAGSATATLIANYTALIGLIGYIYIKDLPLRLRGKELRYLWCDIAVLKTIVVKGFPMGLQMIIISLSALALIGLVNRQGVDTTAAFGVALQLWTYVQMPAMALGAAVSAMAAQNIGAGLWDRVNQITRVGIIQTLAITAGMIVALTLADRSVLAVHGWRQPGAADCAPHPPRRDLELPALRRDDGAVRDGSRERRGVDPADRPRDRNGPGALRLHFRDLSLASRRRDLDELSGDLVHQPCARGRLLRPRGLEEGAHVGR